MGKKSKNTKDLLLTPLGSGSMTTALKSDSCNSLFSFLLLLLRASFIHRVLASLSTSQSCMWVAELEEKAVGVVAGDRAVGWRWTQLRGGKVLQFAPHSPLLSWEPQAHASAAAILVFADLGAAWHPWATLSLIEKGNLSSTLVPS